MSNKLVYVPRNWKVNYVDEHGNEVEFNLQANAEYKITTNDGQIHNVTVSGIRTDDEGKVHILPKVYMYPGYMYVMKKEADTRIDVDNINSIERIAAMYIREKRSIKDIPELENDERYTFAFDSEKYPSQYRISVLQGEFISLAVKDPREPNHGIRSIYGHIKDVTDDKIIVSRYSSKRGVRDVFDYTVDINTLIGIYRYKIDFIPFEEFEKMREQQRESASRESEEQ